MKIILWDIDGTLLKTGKRLFPSSHLKALNKVKKNGFKKDDMFPGATDLEVILHLADINDERVSKKESIHILQELDSVTKKNFEGALLPGVIQVLKDLKFHNFLQGIVTGNTQTRALVKLKASNLIDFFQPNLLFFGGHFESRVKFIRHVKNLLSANDLILIGDSPRDVQAAKKNCVKIISVATGNFNVDQLTAMKPNLVLSNFKIDKTKFFNFLKH